MKVCLLLIGVCLGVALGRPSILQDNGAQEKEVINDVDTNLLSSASNPQQLTLAATENKESTWDNIRDAVHMDFLSVGKVASDPDETGDIDGNLYNRLSFGFGPKHEYKIYADHKLEGRFGADNGGDLSLGYESPLWILGGINLRASQFIGGSGNASFDWRLDLNDDQW